MLYVCRTKTPRGCNEISANVRGTGKLRHYSRRPNNLRKLLLLFNDSVIVSFFTVPPSVRRRYRVYTCTRTMPDYQIRNIVAGDPTTTTTTACNGRKLKRKFAYGPCLIIPYGIPSTPKVRMSKKCLV